MPYGVSGTYCYYVAFDIPAEASPTVEGGMYNFEIYLNDLKVDYGDTSLNENLDEGGALPQPTPSGIPVNIAVAKAAGYKTFSNVVTSIFDNKGNLIQLDSSQCQLPGDLSLMPSSPTAWCGQVLNISISNDGKSARCTPSLLSCFTDSTH